MNIESLIKAVVVLHNGNARQHALTQCSVAKQIQQNVVRPMIIDGESVDVVDMIVSAKYHPFTKTEQTASRKIEALLIVVTRQMESKLILQTNHTECPVRDGEIVVEEEEMTTQINQPITIEEYSKMCKEFELYFEEN